ncbi:MAG TPA: hypothetical protein VHV82_18850 [Sporichthyaceae bacterium]|jgi:hypothetical protein|nr:hypothetical protein [Sporichthyaceae bacterium]
MGTQAGLPAEGTGCAVAPLWRRARRRGLDIAAGLLGAVTAVGMAVVLFLGTVAVAFVLARVRHADAETVATRILAHAIAVDAIGAVLLCLLVLIAFFSGGYVAARISRRDGRRQALAVWLWALPAPVGITLAVLALGAGTRQVIVAARPDASTGWLAVCLAVLSLLGALLGGETGRLALRRSPQFADGLVEGSDLEVAPPVAAAVVPAR